MNLAQFDGQKYLNLETYRKSGKAEATPVWFLQEGNTFLIRTVRDSGKVKRARNNPKVRIMPCGPRGEPKGEWIDATASIVSATESERVNVLLTKKYGLIKRLFDLFTGNRRQYDTIRVDVSSA
jgi:hypothetical protein